jgi:hypothetical protein
MQPLKIPVADEETREFPHKSLKKHDGKRWDNQDYWDFLKKMKTLGNLMGCSIKATGKDGQFLLDTKPTGLIMNHAYAILDIFEI